MIVKAKYGYSLRHDAALDLCIASGRTCPTGCVKDGAPNCYAHVVGHYGIEQCEFGRSTAHLQPQLFAPEPQEQPEQGALL